MGLNGFINGTAIPSNVTYLSLGVNQLKGSIPSQWPMGLTFINLGTNQLSGSIPLTFPTELTELYLDQNELTGNVPSVLPTSLVNFHIYRNQLSGDLPSFPSAIQQLLLGITAFSGNNGNQFTGSLQLNKPRQLLINDNWISDVFIQDTSALTKCDLSNNPLLDSPNIANLTMCTKDGLYNVSSLPNKIVTTSSLPAISNPSTISFIPDLTSASANASCSTATSFTHYLATAAETVGTVLFAQILVPFIVNYKMVICVVINCLILMYVLVKTPFKREFNTIMRRRNIKEENSSGGF